MITFNPELVITIQGQDPVTIKILDYSVTYDNFKNVANAFIKKVNVQIVLWEGADYVAIGQFTDDVVDARIKEILGKDPAGYLSFLTIPSLQRGINKFVADESVAPQTAPKTKNTELSKKIVEVDPVVDAPDAASDELP